MGIKGWSLRDGLLEGEGWRREMLGRLVGGKQWGSPHMALSEDAEWGKQRRERMQGDGDPLVNAGVTGLLEYLPEELAVECLAAPWLPLLPPPPALPPSLRTTNSGWWLAPLPVSFTYVNDNPQEVIVGERRELASLDLLNHFITGTSFEWPSSAGWPAPHLSDHKEIKISPSLETTGHLPQLWKAWNERVRPNIFLPLFQRLPHRERLRGR